MRMPFDVGHLLYVGVYKRLLQAMFEWRKYSDKALSAREFEVSVAFIVKCCVSLTNSWLCFYFLSLQPQEFRCAVNERLHLFSKSIDVGGSLALSPDFFRINTTQGASGSSRIKLADSRGSTIARVVKALLPACGEVAFLRFCCLRQQGGLACEHNLQHIACACY